MKILVVGASGRIGQWVVRLAYERTMNVTAVVRPNSSYQPAYRVETIKGEVTNPEFVKSIIEDGTTIISCIGIRRAGLSPWAKIQSPPNLVETVTRNIIQSANSKKNIRLIWISAAGVGESINHCTSFIKKMITLGNIGVAYRDLEKAETLIKDSSIDAVMIRPVTLIPGHPTAKAKKVSDYTLFSSICTGDVAKYIIRMIDSKELSSSKKKK